MGHFLATIEGNRGEASRIGTKGSGIAATVNGWDCGISVSGICNGDTGQDEFEVTLTSGSGYGRSRHIGTFIKEDIEKLEEAGANRIDRTQIEPRELLDDEQPEGYMESDNDFVLHNIGVCVEFLEGNKGGN